MCFHATIQGDIPERVRESSLLGMEAVIGTGAHEISKIVVFHIGRPGEIWDL